MIDAQAAVTRARAIVGTPFRLHGRSPAGVDCVGVVAHAYALPVPTGYALRSGDSAAVVRAAARAELTPVGDTQPGDVILCASGPGQVHLAIATGDGFVHADAGLRRVVERPGPPPWPILARWRKGE